MVEITSAPTGTSGGTQERNTTCNDTAQGDKLVSAKIPPMPLYVVVVETRGQNFTRRPYLSIASAEKAVRRAQDRGVYACIRLLACTPAPGGDLA